MDFHSTQEFRSTGPLEKALEQTPNAIALDGISSAKKRNLKILHLNGIAPTPDNIVNGSYKLFRPLYLVVQKRPSRQVRSFITWLQSKEGQAVIESQGTVPLKKGNHLWIPYRQHMANVRGSHKGIFE